MPSTMLPRPFARMLRRVSFARSGFARSGPIAAVRAALLALVLAPFVAAVPAMADYTVVLDPGHGGRDGGAVGRMGTREKTVTLAFARALGAELRRAGVTVHLTRTDDSSLRLSERVAFARAHAAQLLVSLHADSIRHRKLRGASVYTLSEKATDQLAASLAEGEARSDVLAGFEGAMSDDQGVADILLDLMRRETETFADRFAELAVSELKGSTRTIRNPHRSANFRVLRAPDVPSVLIELGYLSNRADEAQLIDPQWIARVAGALADAIVTHARGTGAELAGG